MERAKPIYPAAPTFPRKPRYLEATALIRVAGRSADLAALKVAITELVAFVQPVAIVRRALHRHAALVAVSNAVACLGTRQGVPAAGARLVDTYRAHGVFATDTAGGTEPIESTGGFLLHPARRMGIGGTRRHCRTGPWSTQAAGTARTGACVLAADSVSAVGGRALRAGVATLSQPLEPGPPRSRQTPDSLTCKRCSCRRRGRTERSHPPRNFRLNRIGRR
jgi:hypothetical protein